MKRILATIASLALVMTLGAATAAADTPGYEILTGCLELSSAGDYVLRSSVEAVTLHNAGGMDKHVGRTVRVTGRWQDADGGRRLRVAKIEWVAEGCG